MIDLGSNALTLIGSFCFTIINQNNRNVQPQVTEFIFLLGLLSFVRLIVICSFGDNVGCAVEKLICNVYENQEIRRSKSSENQNHGLKMNDESMLKLAEKDEEQQQPEEWWTIDEVMAFREMKKLAKKQFRVSMIAGTVTVQQSTILAILGFVLNYIVILLQTENFAFINNVNSSDNNNNNSLVV